MQRCPKILRIRRVGVALLCLGVMTALTTVAEAYVFRFEDVARFWPPQKPKRPYTLSYTEVRGDKTFIYRHIVFENFHVKQTLLDGKSVATVWKDATSMLIQKVSLSESPEVEETATSATDVTAAKPKRRGNNGLPLYDDVLFGFGTHRMRAELVERGFDFSKMSLVRHDPDVLEPVYYCIGCTRYDDEIGLVVQREPLRPMAVRYSSSTKPYHAIVFSYAGDSLIPERIALHTDKGTRELILTEAPRKVEQEEAEALVEVTNMYEGFGDPEPEPAATDVSSGPKDGATNNRR